MKALPKYGFAQVRLHPTDFAQGDPILGTINKPNETKFQELAH
jgi:hypothetical protein